MNPFILPPTSEVNKIIPKNAFDIFTNSKEKKQFSEFVNKMIWLNKLSVETINLAGNEISEIQIFKIELKIKQEIDFLISIIDKVIPYPIIFFILYEEEYYISTSQKHINPIKQDKTVIDWKFKSEWILCQDLRYSLNLRKSLDFIFLDFCNQLVQPCHKIFQSMAELVAYQKALNQINKEINRIETAIKNCKQFNKKVELNLELGKIQSKRKELIHH
jgi:hypothetical protein